MSEPFRLLVETRTANVSDLFPSPLNKRLVVSVGVPIVRDGQVRWVLSAGMTPDSLGRLLSSHRLPAGSTGTVLDRRHAIVAHSTSRELIGTGAAADLVQRIAAEPEGTIRSRTATDTPTMTAFSRSPVFGWMVAITIPRAGIVGTPVGPIVWVGAAMLLVGVAVALWTGQRISHPIERLAAAARRLGRGEPVEPVPSRVIEVFALSEALAVAAEERARAQAEVARYTRASQAKSEFLSRMSHELRTPLNSILGFGQILELEELRTRPRDCVTQILIAGRHLLALINEILDLSRIEAGQLRLSLEPVRLAETVRSAIELVRPLAAPRGIELRTGPPDEQCHVLADPQRLQQVLLNLLSSAVKYNRNGGVVTVTCDESGPGRLQVQVTDTGPGFRPEDLDRLFTPFERFGAEGSGVEGSGLGLALSKRLVGSMNGTLEAKSMVGAGSTFTLELPLVEPPTVNLSRVEASPSARSRRGGVVLYIEDNLANFRLVERLVELLPGTTLLSSMQGRLGVEVARERQPDLILLDLHLPDLAGEEVLRRLLAEPRTRQIPVIVLSADETPGQIERLLAAGARAFLNKPIDVRRLLAVLDEHMGGAADAAGRT